MLRAASHNRRGRVRCWLPALLAAAALFLRPLPLAAQDQHEAAVGAMAPSTVTGPVLGNRIAAPDLGRFPQAQSPKTRIHEVLAAPPAPAPPGTPPPPAGTGAPPTAPAAVEAERGRPLPPGTAQPGPGPVPAPVPSAEAPPPGAPGQPAATPPLNPDQVQITGDTFSYSGGVTTVRGNVELRYQDLTIRSALADLDEDRVWGTFRGNVSLEAQLYKAVGRDLRVNLDTEEFGGHDVAAEVEPKFFNDYVTAPLYVRAQEVVGRPGQVIGSDGIGTSCNYWPDPHWMLRSHEVIYRPGDEVVFERPTLYMFGHRLLRYPWDLRLSLVRKENRFLPEVGRNEVEGYYAKFAYGYVLNEENDGFLRLNLTEKRGIGFGVDHTLDTASQQGDLSLFFEPSQGSFSGRLDHRAQLNRTLNSNLNLSFQEDSGYGITSDSLNGDLTFRYDTSRTNALLGFQQSIISSDSSTSRRFSSNVSYKQRVGRDGDWTLRSTYRASQFSGTTGTDEELETELNWRQQFRAFSVDMLAQKRYDLDASGYTGDSGYYALNRVPDFTLRSDSTRLGDLRVFGSAFDATLYLGLFEQRPEVLDVGRAGIDLRLPGHVQEFGGNASLRTSARFQQMFYTDASAQWIGQLESEYYLKLSRSWESRLSFSYLRPNGFAPLRLDLSSPTSILYWQVVRLVPDRLRLDFSFGRDFHNDTYQDAIVRSEIMLSPRNRLEAQGGYSLELAQWRPLNLRWVYATERTWWSAVTVNYDLDQTDLTNVSLDLDWTPSLKWRVQFLGGYSGGGGGLDQADVRVTRDLHCMLASFTYINSTREIRLGLGIKAFPSDTRTFGVGGRGQYFESNFGDQY